MNMYSQLICLLSLPFAGLLIPLCLWSFVKTTPSMTEREKELLLFTPLNVALTIPVVHTVSDVKCPVPSTPPPSVAGGNSPVSYPPVSLDSLVPTAGEAAKKEFRSKPAYQLSLVLLGEGRKMAIVDGYVLREGEAFGPYTISLIEKNRVKLKSLKEELWVNLKL